jgi:hypothetical protein
MGTIPPRALRPQAQPLSTAHEQFCTIVRALQMFAPGCCHQNPDNHAHVMVHCPMHDDVTPSFSITEREDRVLIHYHAGCGTRDANQLAASIRPWRKVEPPGQAAGDGLREAPDEETAMTLLVMYIITATNIWIFPGREISPAADAGGFSASISQEAWSHSLPDAVTSNVCSDTRRRRLDD